MDAKAERESVRDGRKSARILSEHPEDLLYGRSWRVAWAILREALLRLWDDEALPLAGNIAFRAILAIFPFLIFVSSVTAFLGDQGMADRLIAFLITIVPPDVVGPLAAEIRTVMTVQRGDILSVGVLLTLWFAVGGVDSVRVGLNRAYGVREHRSTLKLYLLYLVVVLGGTFVLVAVAYLLVLAPVIGALAHRLVPEFEPASVTFELIRLPAAAVILTLALFAAHAVLPARWHRFSSIWPGVVLTVIVWMMLGGAFSIYLTRFANYASYYAGLAGVMAALFFVYLAALVLIFGGEINRAIRIRRLGQALRQDE